MNTIKVVVVGAGGKMGQEVMKMVLNDSELKLVGAIDLKDSDQDVANLLGCSPTGVKMNSNLDKVLKDSNADVIVDFTSPKSVYNNVKVAIQNNVYPVVGTTGLSTEELDEIDLLLKNANLAGIFAPNFAIGAVLMMEFAKQAAKYMPHVEIIELHHDQKIDAPSGTAIKTAEIIQESRQSMRQGVENELITIDGARGGNYDGMRIHSVRLPGLVAHQEVIFGSQGQILTIKHDSITRESFMPGVNLAIKEVKKHSGIVYGLDKIII